MILSKRKYQVTVLIIVPQMPMLDWLSAGYPQEESQQHHPKELISSLYKKKV
jgi:hypothetical protein